MGTNNIISKAQRNEAQQSFQLIKAPRKMRNLNFLISEAQHNFRNQLFDSVEAQRNSAIAERHFCTKLKHNLTFAVKLSQHNAKTANYAILDRKRVNNLLNAGNYQYCDWNRTKLSSTHRIALLTEKNWKNNKF